MENNVENVKKTGNFYGAISFFLVVFVVILIGILMFVESIFGFHVDITKVKIIATMVTTLYGGCWTAVGVNRGIKKWRGQ